SVDFHAMIEVPKGEKHPSFPAVPELETFARSERDRKIMTMQRAFRVAGQPFVLPPGTPKDRVEIIQEAFRKTYKDPEFHKEYKKLTADEPTPLMPDAHEKTIREVPPRSGDRRNLQTDCRRRATAAAVKRNSSNGSSCSKRSTHFLAHDAGEELGEALNRA